MEKQILMRFTVILFVIGFMVAIQYNTINSDEERDTRDTWEIRQELSREKQLHSELLSEISSLDGTLEKYSGEASENPQTVLKGTLADLRAEAGLSTAAGPGIEIKISPSLEAVAMGMEIAEVPPDLLIRLMNEVNRFDGLELMIADQRIIGTTAIRDINGYTTVNAERISTPPFTIKIVADGTEQAKKLYSHLTASEIHEDYYIDNLMIDISEPQEELMLRPYDGEINAAHLEAAEEEE